jgi:hypothetical protein
MIKDEFEKLMPHEFWREVVDRINEKMPDTLLLAEAFWLMEGYFVRTLGMHRVYNSAFMNMLKMEENDKYRSVVKNVLEFDPRILKRFVNFMNNPDEQTAVAQFGKGDKYFGVCLMMVTMPGLPMFGHGQIEGFNEKYGMEYRRAYWDEVPDWDLVRRHEAEIFPLMRKRHLFSEVANFVLYDFFTPRGRVDENVFAYSNRCGDERALIIYHNKYRETEGWIRTSCGMAVGVEGSGTKRVIQKTLAEGLGINPGPGRYYIFKDYKANLEYLRSGRELAAKGLFVRLGAFHYRIFTDFREVTDGPAGHYRRLAKSLQGRGVPNIEEALRELILSPVHAPFRQLIGRTMFEEVLGDAAKAERRFGELAEEFLRAVKKFTRTPGDVRRIRNDTVGGLRALARLGDAARGGGAAAQYLAGGMRDTRGFWSVALPWVVMRDLGKLRSREDYQSQSAAFMDELLLVTAIADALQEHSLDPWSSTQQAALVKILTASHAWYDPSSEERSRAAVGALLRDYEVQLYLNVNRHGGVLWFNKEKMESLLYWLFASSAAAAPAGLESRYRIIAGIMEAAHASGWEFEKLLAKLPSEPPQVPPEP